MTLATRAAFTGALPDAPPRGDVIALTSAPDGGWTHVTEPKAVYISGTTYFCFIEGTSGYIKAGSFVHATGAVSTYTVGTAPEVDVHDAPSIIARSDGKFLLAWSGHNGAALYTAISSSSGSVASWGAPANIDSSLGGTAYTYCSLAYIGSTLYLFYRDRAAGVDSVCYSTSADDGATWAAQTVLATQSGQTPYFVIDGTGSRIDMAVSAGLPGTDATCSVHHLYTTGSGWLASDGSALGSPPFTVTSLTTVYDASDGVGWPGSIVAGPSVSVMLDAGAEWAYRVFDWSGSAWGQAMSVGVGRDDINIAVATLYDADTLYGSLWNGSSMDLWRWKRGAGWAPVPVSVGSSEDITPARIHDAPADRHILWLRGTYTSYLSNSLQVMAGR